MSADMERDCTREDRGAARCSLCAAFAGAAAIAALSLFGVAAGLESPAGTLTLSVLSQTDVFVSGTMGYDTYRIPSTLVTAKGTVLAFSEGRKTGRGDAGDIDIVSRRSLDGGNTWSAMSVLWDDGANTCGNPCAVQDRETGTIWLLLTHNLGEDTEDEIWAGTSKSSRTVWLTSSRDDGVTWSAPGEITVAAKRPSWSWYATGPGIGIQLRHGPKKGRLVIPCDHGVLGGRDYYAHVLYSDDHGATWQIGGSPPDPTSSECQAVELSDGRLLLDIRTHFARAFRRKFSFSSDAGATWSRTQFVDELPDPHCQASIIRYEGRLIPNGAVAPLVFSNPASTRRERMTVRLSFDEGASWPVSRLLHAGPSAYSCLTVLPDSTIGCMYERGQTHAYERISLARLAVGARAAAAEGRAGTR